MTVETNPVPHERALEHVRATSSGFLNANITPEDADRAAERWVEGRWWAATDNDSIVATARTYRQYTSLPGGFLLPTSGLTAVTTQATHRRRGLLREMLVKALTSDKEAGESLSTLIAAEYPIYGRFGYGPATETATYSLKATARWLTAGEGTVELVDNDVYAAVVPTIYDSHHRSNPSEIERDATDWRNRISGRPSKPWKGFQAICRNDEGVATGYVRYTIKEGWEARQPTGIVDVDELIAVTPGAEARLWRYLCEIDWIATITAEDRSVGERVPWWIEDGRDFRQTERSDFVWARPLDVAACLSARSYAAPIDAVIDVIDPLGFTNGRFRLTSDGGPGACAMTTKSADLAVPISTVGSMLFGGHSLRVLASVGLADEHTAGAIDIVDRAFRTSTPPWSATWF